MRPKPLRREIGANRGQERLGESGGKVEEAKTPEERDRRPTEVKKDRGRAIKEVKESKNNEEKNEDISGSVEEGKRDKVEEAKNREGREEILKSQERKKYVHV